MTAPEAGEAADISLPADLSIGRVVRGAVRDRLDEWGVPDDASYRAMIVATELASNALLHAAPPYLLRLSTDGRGVHISIHDSLVLTPSVRQYDALALTGRGLQLVADCSRSWGVRSREDGKEVWADVSFEDDDEPPSMMETSGFDSGESTDSDEPVGTTATTGAPGAPGPPGGPGATGTTGAGLFGPGSDSRVRFLGVPIDAYLALQEWNDGVVRECELIAALEPPPADMPPRLLELAIRLSGRFATEREGYRDVVAEARTEGITHVELDGSWPQPSAASVQAAGAFLAMMEELDGYCRTGILLTEPPDRVVVELRRWFVTEMRAQILLGEAPIPFDETDGPERV